MPPPQDAPPDPDFPSISIASGFTKEALVDQIAQNTTLDGKANFVLGAATAFIGTSLALQTVLPFKTPAPLQLTLQSILLVIYLATMVTAFLAYRVRPYVVAPDPEELAQEYLNQGPLDTNRAIYRAMLDAFNENEPLIKERIRHLNLSFFLLLLEAVLIILVFFLQFIVQLLSHS